MTNKKKEKPKHLGRGLQSLLRPIMSDSEHLDPLSVKTQYDSNFPPDNTLHDSLK